MIYVMPQLMCMYMMQGVWKERLVGYSIVGMPFSPLWRKQRYCFIIIYIYI